MERLRSQEFSISVLLAEHLGSPRFPARLCQSVSINFAIPPDMLFVQREVGVGAASLDSPLGHSHPDTQHCCTAFSVNAAAVAAAAMDVARARAARRAAAGAGAHLVCPPHAGLSTSPALLRHGQHGVAGRLGSCQSPVPFSRRGSSGCCPDAGGWRPATPRFLSTSRPLRPLSRRPLRPLELWAGRVQARSGRRRAQGPVTRREL